MNKLDQYECVGQINLFDFVSLYTQECLIGIGSQNATGRRELQALFGVKDDREARDIITKMRINGCVIINDGQGKGYYQPTVKDYSKVVKHWRGEMSRIKKLQDSLAVETQWIKQFGGEEDKICQMDG